jgi:hypothetical protein
MQAQWLDIACDVVNGSRVGNNGYPFVPNHPTLVPNHPIIE